MALTVGSLFAGVRADGCEPLGLHCQHADATPAPPPDPVTLRLAQQMFSDGVDVARSYGDNAFHLHSAQLDRQFWKAWERAMRGEFSVQIGHTAPMSDATPAPPEDK